MQGACTGVCAWDQASPGKHLPSACPDLSCKQESLQCARLTAFNGCVTSLLPYVASCTACHRAHTDTSGLSTSASSTGRSLLQQPDPCRLRSEKPSTISSSVDVPSPAAAKAEDTVHLVRAEHPGSTQLTSRCRRKASRRRCAAWRSAWTAGPCPRGGNGAPGSSWSTRCGCPTPSACWSSSRCACMLATRLRWVYMSASECAWMGRFGHDVCVGSSGAQAALSPCSCALLTGGPSAPSPLVPACVNPKHRTPLLPCCDIINLRACVHACPWHHRRQPPDKERRVRPQPCKHHPAGCYAWPGQAATPVHRTVQYSTLPGALKPKELLLALRVTLIQGGVVVDAAALVESQVPYCGRMQHLSWTKLGAAADLFFLLLRPTSTPTPMPALPAPDQVQSCCRPSMGLSEAGIHRQTNTNACIASPRPSAGF